MRRPARRVEWTRIALCWIGLLTSIGMALSLLSSRGMAGTVCTQVPGGTCEGTRDCDAVIRVPDLGTTFTPHLTGPALAIVTNAPDMSHLNMTWIISSFSGSDPTLGNISVSLDPAFTSTGLVEFATPTQKDFFPAINTNFFFFDFTFSNLGTTTFVTDGPAIIRGVIDSIPPDGAVYTLVNPVNLYTQGDPSRTTVATIESATVHFHGSGPPLPISEDCPEPSSALMAVTAVAIALWYSRRVARPEWA